MHRIIFLISFTIGVGLLACQDDPDCVSITTDFANVRFYNFENGEIDTVDVNSITLEGSDSVLYADTTISNVMTIPLNPAQRTVQLAFDTEFGLDTVVLSYATRNRLISEDCGLEILFAELDYVRNDFDSINIVNQELVESFDENIRIFN